MKEGKILIYPVTVKSYETLLFKILLLFFSLLINQWSLPTTVFRNKICFDKKKTSKLFVAI